MLCAHCRRIVRVPGDAMSGTKHVLGIIPLGVESHDAKDNPDSVLLRFSDHQQVRYCMTACLTSAACASAYTQVAVETN